MNGYTVDLVYPGGARDVGWDYPYPGFMSAIATGARPYHTGTNNPFVTGTDAYGNLTLDGCSVFRYFENGCTTGGTAVGDDRRLQLYLGGKLVGDVSAPEAFASNGYANTWDTWKAYYEAAGYVAKRYGTWDGVYIAPLQLPVQVPAVITDPVVTPPVVVPPINTGNGNGSGTVIPAPTMTSDYMPLMLGAAVLLLLMRK